MSQENNFSRRDFIKAASLAGVTSILASQSACGETGKAEPEDAKNPGNEKVSTRPFGKTGIDVSMLSLGGMFDIPTNQTMLKMALNYGVTYWDTADCYGNGRSEEGIGKYFAKYPEDRKRVFLVTKSDRRDPEGMSYLLERSLKRMKIDSVDLYFIHGLKDISELDEQTKKWAEKAKAEKKIRFFGFSTHTNMEDCMIGASKLGWIDGIMMTYNYRIMNSPKMVEAVQRCKEAGIGMTAMKSQASRTVGNTDTETEIKLLEQFLKKGFTDCQAKLLTIWENKNIASICSQMPNMTILKANVSAALQKPRLSALDKKLLEQYAQETCSGYCAGCTNICEKSMAQNVPIGDIMRYMMYYNSYGEHDMARDLFAELPKEVRQSMASLDYTEAERKCPNHIAIGSIMKEACQILHA